MRHNRVLVGAVAVLLLSGCGGAAQNPGSTQTPSSTGTTSSAPSRLEAAYGGCGSVGELADAGKTLIFDTTGDDDASGDSLLDVECVLAALDVPKAVEEHLDTTRALDGMQTDEWSGIKARWTYHPDDGLQLTLMDSQ